MSLGRGGKIKFGVYGKSGTGKTRLASTFPKSKDKPLVIVGTEDGTKSVKNSEEVKFIKLRQVEDLDELIKHALRPGKFETVVLDTAGGFQTLVLKSVLGISPDTVITPNWGMCDQGTWGIINAQFIERMSALLDCAERYAVCNVVVIAHEKTFSAEGHEKSDVIQPYVGAALTPGTSGWLAAACDYFGQCYIRDQIVVSAAGDGGIEVSIETKTGKHEYCLRIGTSSTFQTKFRWEGDELPEQSIVNPNYAKILALINSGK